MEFRRPTNTFLLSKHLEDKAPWFYPEFCQTFNLQSDINPNLPEELSDDLKAFIKRLEELIFEPVSEELNNEFDNHFKAKIFSNFDELNQQIMTEAETGIRLNWDNFFPKELARNDPELAETLLKEENAIVKFYNFLTNFINKDQLLRLFSAIITTRPEIINEKNSSNIPIVTVTIGITNSSDRKKHVPITVLYTTNMLNSARYKDEPLLEKHLPTSLWNPFMSGLYSFGTKFSWFNIFAHEMGHVVHAFFPLANNEDNQNFGKKIDANNFKELLETPDAYSFLFDEQEIVNDKFNHISHYLKTFWPIESFYNTEIYSEIIQELKKKGFNFDDDKNNQPEKILAYLVALPGVFGRLNLLKLFRINAGENIREELPAAEYFAEAFAYWAMTPRAERNFYWEVFDQFFEGNFLAFKSE